MTTTISPSSNPVPPWVAGARRDLRTMRATLVAVTLMMAAVGVSVGAGLILYSPGTPIEVSETDYAINLPTTLRAGDHALTLTNDGVQPHELLLFRTDLAADALPVDASGDVIEDSPLLHGVLDSGAGLASHKTQSLSVTLERGHYVAVCNLPGHYRLGMRLDVTVTK